MNKILLESKSVKSTDLFSNFSINLALAIAEKNTKVLLFSTCLSPSYLSIIEKHIKSDTKTKVIPPFKIYDFNNNCSLLLLTSPKEDKNLINNIGSLSRTLKRQIDLIGNKFDFLLAEKSNLWNDLDSLLDEKLVDNKINFINIDDFEINPIKNNINTDNKNVFCLINYDSNNKTHLEIYRGIKQIYGINEIFVFTKSNLFNHALFNFNRWEQSAITLEDLANKIINNKK